MGALDRWLGLMLAFGIGFGWLAFIGTMTAILLTLVLGDRAYFAWYAPVAALAFGSACYWLRSRLAAASPAMDAGGGDNPARDVSGGPGGPARASRPWRVHGDHSNGSP